MHGVVMKADGETVEVSIGEKEGDPQFCVTDLLPHLAAEQNGRKLGEGLKGEELNIIIGVTNDDFEPAIRAIYDIFVKTEL